MEKIEFEGIPESRKLLGMRLLKRVGDYALYTTNCYSFEVHKIRIKTKYYNPYTDVLAEKAEVLASSENFGNCGWCFTRLSTIIRYFGMFGEHVDEIVHKLEALGYAELPSPKRDVLGYVF